MRHIYAFLSVLLIVKFTLGYDNPYRLPGSTKPSHYKVILKIDPDQPQSFSGEVRINIFAQESTNQIVIHSNVSKIENITLTEGSDSTNLYLSHDITDDDKHFLTIDLNKNLTLNQLYVLKITYIGKYGDYVDGLYLSNYTDGNGVKRNLATTQFAPADARKVFPCYDEPAFKSTFQMNVYAPEAYGVISNEDITNESDLPLFEDGLRLRAFKETLPMCSYLIAILVSGYTYKSNLEHGEQIFGKKYRIFARPGVEDQMDYALEHGQKAMSALEEYTQVEYVFSKLDNAALPNLFYNAMENWGLIIYREPRLLYDENTTTTKDLQRMSTVITHESAHMWFGNLLSPEWWDFVWLSEGFATYFENLITDKVAPEWRLMDQFILNNNHRAMVLDATNSTNAMTNPLGPPQELSDNFNLIAYQKAGSVIRMFQHVMGEVAFREGINNYLTAIPFGNTEPNILFENLQKAIDGTDILPQNVNMTDVFSSWSDQKGFPVLSVTRITETGEVRLTQQRYHENSSLTTEEKYWIPINWVTSKNISFEDTSAQIWFDPKIDVLTLPFNLDENDWLIINKKETGYYRVMYETPNWYLLINGLKSENFGGIHLLSRTQLIDDSMNFAKTLRISYNITLDLLSYLQEELDFIPWFAANEGFGFLNTVIPAAQNYDKFRTFIVRITSKAYGLLGYDEGINDDPITKMNRLIIAELACNAGSLACRNRANEKLMASMNNSSISLETDFKDSLYCAGMRNANENLWNYFWTEYLNSPMSPDKNFIIKGLGCSENSNILERYVSIGVSDDTDIVEPDRTAIIQSVINSGPIGVDVAVDFLYNNFTSLQLKTQTTAIITNLGNKIVTEENENKFKLFAENPILTPGEKTAANSALNAIEKNRKWLENTLKDIDSWLNDNVI